jgi:hypothetical protein
MAKAKKKKDSKKKSTKKEEKPTKLNMSFEEAIALSVKTKIPKKNKR